MKIEEIKDFIKDNYDIDEILFLNTITEKILVDYFLNESNSRINRFFSSDKRSAKVD